MAAAVMTCITAGDSYRSAPVAQETRYSSLFLPSYLDKLTNVCVILTVPTTAHMSHSPFHSKASDFNDS